MTLAPILQSGSPPPIQGEGTGVGVHLHRWRLLPPPQPDRNIRPTIDKNIP